MPASAEAYGDTHQATYDNVQKPEYELTQVGPNQYGITAVRGTVIVPERQRTTGQLSEIAHGDGDETEKRIVVPERMSERDYNPDR